MPNQNTPRYELRDTLGAGGMGAVYEAYDRLTRTHVALKRVHMSSALATANDFQLALAQEFRLLASLRHPHIISVLDYGFDAEGQPFFTMELLKNALTLRAYAVDVPLTTQVQLLVQALEALRYLHRRGIVHRDLKPENVLVLPDPTQPSLKILDFGLAREEATPQVAGTLAYLAPEVLQGGAATPLSDLYALGMMLYEIIAGAHPFKTDSLNKWIEAILMTDADVEKLPIPDALKAVMSRLLARDPSARYPDADSVIAALRQALALPTPPESQTTRESFLQAAHFVGREQELSQLTLALQHITQATTPPRGAAFLVSGESGAGKSRLVEELRIRALVAGTLLVRGQAVANSRLPYQLWRDPLRRLLLTLDISDTEAGVLQSIIPDISDVLQRPVKPARQLDGSGGQQRLAQTVLALFQRSPKPITLILEDAHWAGEETALIKLLVERIAELPLLLVVTYRDDERPQLAQELPDMQRIQLGRLSDEDVVSLSVSMLGENGRIPHVIDLIQRETEGNIFFIVEVVRALAESAGNLSDVGRMTLPPRVFSGGIRTVIERRLAAVPEEAALLLNYAALIGRKPDIAVLRMIEPNADALLMRAGEAAVMTIDDGAWQFAHDKLRDALLNDIADPSFLHQRIASIMETLYGDDPNHAPALAQHHAGAGNLAREAHYSLIAGDNALTRSSYQAALAFLERALQLKDHLDSSATQARLQLILGETCYTLGDYPRARTLLTECVAQPDVTPTVRARAFNFLGNIALAFGDYQAARDALTEALRASDDKQERGRATRSLGVVASSQGQLAEARTHYEQALPLLRDVEDTVAIAATLSNLAALATGEQNYAAAQDLYTESIALFKSASFLWGIAYGTTQLGITRLAAGDAAGARTDHETALQLCRQIGHQWGICFVNNNLADACLALGDLATAQKALREALDIAMRLNITVMVVDTLHLFGVLWMLVGDTVDAVELWAFVEAHPSTEHETRAKVATRLKTLEAQLTSKLFSEAVERGKTMTLDSAIRQAQG